VHHGVEIGDRGLAAGEPGELVVAQARNADRIDLDHPQVGGKRRQLGRARERSGKPQPVEQEAAQLRGANLPHG